jgi:hypothetical protein
MSQIDYSSVPTWARSAAPVDAALDTTGRSYLLVGVGSDAQPIVQRWADHLGDRAQVRQLHAADTERAGALLRDALGVATVGIRVLVAGSTASCLRLRGIATIAGVEDDELRFAPFGTGLLDVFCAHCRAVTTAQAQVDDVVECCGCRRTLLVYHHVSRCSGQYLGFMVDAERWTR